MMLGCGRLLMIRLHRTGAFPPLPLRRGESETNLPILHGQEFQDSFLRREEMEQVVV